MNRFIVASLFLFFIACNGDKNSYHLPPKTMQKMLLDAHAAEAYSTLVKKDTAHKGDNKNMDSLAVYYKEIFSHYHVTPEQFYQSVDWYKKNPEELDSMYALLVEDITKIENTRPVK